jgi:hypothetical protein
MMPPDSYKFRGARGGVEASQWAEMAPLIPFLLRLDTTPTWRCAQIEDTGARPATPLSYQQP